MGRVSFHGTPGVHAEEISGLHLSSTFRDLADERQDAMRAVLDLGDIPSGMEIFPAAGRPAANGCTKSNTTASASLPARLAHR
jgi:hypothetical protein